MNRIGRVFLPGLAFLAVTLMGFPQTSSAGADLHEAVANNNVEGARAELTAGTDPDTAGIVGLAPLHIAARAGHTEIALLLLEHGADVGARSDACVFQTKVATDSRRSLPPSPRECCH